MQKSRFAHVQLCSLLVFIAAIGLLGNSGFIYAADRTVVGELWSQDG